MKELVKSLRQNSIIWLVIGFFLGFFISEHYISQKTKNMVYYNQKILKEIKNNLHIK